VKAWRLAVLASAGAFVKMSKTHRLSEPAPPGDEEQRLRIDLMTIQIGRLRQEIRRENRKFAVQFVVAMTVAFGVGVVLGRFWLPY
jgi:hypothetical protein